VKLGARAPPELQKTRDGAPAAAFVFTIVLCMTVNLRGTKYPGSYKKGRGAPMWASLRFTAIVLAYSLAIVGAEPTGGNRYGEHRNFMLRLDGRY